LTRGVILIDEIDLHLHPKWQRKVLSDLHNAFPKIQFIVTTHSPFIIQSIDKGKLINLDKMSEEYMDKTIEDISEDNMGIPIPQRSRRFRNLMEVAIEYFKILDQSDTANETEKQKLKHKLDELMIPFIDDPAYAALLNLERIARGMGEK
jgi:predicted ATP-binding protein involved in virulence